VTTDQLLIAGIAGALVVLCGGAYALFLALGYMRRRNGTLVLAYGSYLLLVVSFLALAHALDLSGSWYAVVVFLLLAYLVSPHLIWKLTRATHIESDHGGSGHD